MEPVTLLALGLGLVIAGTLRKRRTQKEAADELRPDVRIRWTEDCEQWEIPVGWYPPAESLWQEQLDALLEEVPLSEMRGETEELEPEYVTEAIEAHLVASTYELLDPQLPEECAEPIVEVTEPDETITVYTFRALQTVVPDADDYWPESEAVLALYDHVFQAQSDALERFIETGDRADSLMFPV